MNFTNEEIELIKELISDWGSDCPNSKSDDVTELGYKLGVYERPTPEQIEEQRLRDEAFKNSDFAKYAANMNKYVENLAKSVYINIDVAYGVKDINVVTMKALEE